MTSSIDIVNRALGEIGATATITAFDDSSFAAQYARINYDPLRRQLLRTAPWGFARKTDRLTLLGSQFQAPPSCPIPWLFKYEYPPDCLAIRYLLPPPPTVGNTPNAPVVGAQVFAPWCPPSRAFRFLRAYDDSVLNAPPIKVVLTNLGWQGPEIFGGALAVYTVDSTNPDLWDDLFTDALVAALANKLVIPLSGNLDLKKDWIALAQQAIENARVSDGNEAIPSSDHTVDWIAVRGTAPSSVYFGGGGNWGPGGYGGLGSCSDGYASMNWGA